MQGISRIAAAAALFALASVAAHGQQAAPAAAPIAAPAASQPAGQAQLKPNLAALQGNVLTVESLIKTESELALAKAKMDRIAAGLDVAQPVLGGKAKGPVRMVVEVDTIAGIEGNYRVHLTANGQPFENVTVGARVHRCQIAAIRNRCVVFAPAAASVKPEQCPTGCWTGVRAEPITPAAFGAQPPSAVGAPLPGGPLPAPLAAAAPKQPMSPPTSNAAR
jgi:hypothetical protein